MISLASTIHKKQFLLLLPFFIFIISFLLRIYKLPEFAAYHEDQVRDMLFIKEHYDNQTAILLGPKASVGNFFLPPFWYYLMSVVYFISDSPVAQAFMVALISALTTVAIFFFMTKFFDLWSAVFASLIYAASHFSIEHSRFAWNPNPIPFFIVLSLIGLYYFLYKKKDSGFIVAAISSNLALQLHYQGSIIFLFIFFYVIYKRRLSWRLFILYSFINIVLFLPFFVYEFTNNFKNTQGIVDFVLQNRSQRYFGVPVFIKFMINDFSLFLSSVFIFKQQIIGYILLAVFCFSFIFVKPKNDTEQTLWHMVLFSIILLFVYRNSLIPFYLLFLIPLLIMYFVIVAKNIMGKKLATYTFIVFLSLGLITSPTFAQTDKTYVSLKEVVTNISQNKNYCVTYDIFKETFIEKKLTYLFAISHNPPAIQNCKKEFLICEPAKCTIALTQFKKTIKIKSLSTHTGVFIYEVTR